MSADTLALAETRLAAIKGYLEEARAEGGELLLPWTWVEQLVDVVDAADQIEAHALCAHYPRETCAESADLERADWCAVCQLAGALARIAWADVLEVPA